MTTQKNKGFDAEGANKLGQLDKTFRRNIIFIGLMFLLFLVVQGVTYLGELVTLFAGVLFACYLLLGPVNVLENLLKRLFPEGLKKRLKKIPVLGNSGFNFRFLSVIVVFISFVLFLIIATGKIFPVVSSQVSGFVKALPSYYSQVENKLESLSKVRFSGAVSKLSSELKVDLKSELESENVGIKETEFPPVLLPVSERKEKVTEEATVSDSGLGKMILFFKNTASSASSSVFDFVTTSLTGLVYGLTGLVLLFYFLLDGHTLRKGFTGLMLPELSEKMERYLDATHFLFFTLLKVQVMTSLLSGLMLYLVYSFLDVEFSGFLSFFFAICSVVPAIGPWVGALPSVLVLLFSGEPVTMLVIFSLLAAFYMLKQRWVLPLIYGDRLDIHPVLIILSLLVCTQLVGPLGFLLAIPLSCLVAAMYSLFYPAPIKNILKGKS